MVIQKLIFLIIIQELKLMLKFLLYQILKLLYLVQVMLLH
nr:MAG TPA: hypothetical protein [Bacteriophage sp.]